MILEVIAAMFGFGLLALIWKSLNTVQFMYDPRSQQLERRQSLQMIEKLVEKRDNPSSPEMLQQHSVERTMEVRESAATDREVSRNAKPAVAPFVHPPEYSDESPFHDS